MMEEKIDRTGWGDGPWSSEPDREQWTTDVGLPGLIVRTRLGFLCGYVAVPREHPAHGKGFDDVNVDVHGGLTYSGACSGAIRHIPAPNESDDVWWLGFDCAHLGDVYPAENAFRPVDGYKTMVYVRAEVESLAKQLSETTPVI